MENCEMSKEGQPIELTLPQAQPQEEPETLQQQQANQEPIDEAIYEVQYNHPLEHVWTLWYLENDRTKHWKDMLNEITQIDSVKTFWSLYNTIKTPSELKTGCDYSMFKMGIK